ncbi:MULTISPECIES: protease modulator HflC [Aeromonas]|uniref:Modulator of FtsH protease HflC n=4 Tax=Bacteria TaxID=2 RepID=A0A3L0WXG4_ECOLX|nr:MULTISPECIES: protease modulator HflC [Aeromonas]ATP08327.1 modulator of FtsH protease HflC [Aeromonas salmonicida subsp. pectinolytica 34mel]ATU96733.1 protease modulator HflC [Aeromonas salmonicida]EQC05851.1 membrane protease family stomatin/prohibitin-like protein [Aeromonas salmonicida subsp. pectinolytica 34mel]KTA80550.1 protein HflC [Aeromonas salmonicida]MBS2782917.1 protease modulator HflC [Aeromonas salmonicida]
MKKIAIGVIAVAAMVCFSSIFVVDEGQKGIVVQFGKVKRVESGEARLYEPGLHFKVPFIDQVRKMDARIQTIDSQADRFVTSEKKDLIIDSYVKWKIEDFSRYYLATGGGNKIQAEDLLKRKINNGLRSEIGNRTIKDIVSGERSTVMEDALMKMARSSELGIRVVDVRIKQINLPVEVSNSIYQRMRAERNAVAREHRSQGREQAEILRADIDRKVTVMIADAESNARQLRGEGDAEAAKIYADSYKKDPEFFSFVRSMEAYRKSFAGGNDLMVLKPDSEFFRYLKSPHGAKQ